ncbi:MAG TPA: adenylate/guanylate cyclase domain-containing protein [Spirochaetia bacterium]|nr:adenylate/guanylate cyclase domain-containing protein [Spirochaetia bacterium]
MSIRAKIVLIVLPLIIVPLVLTGVISSLSARNGITTLATGFLQFKAEQLVTYAQGQWDLLAANGLESTPEYLDASKAAIESFAKSLIRSPTEAIFALGPDGAIALRSGDLSVSAPEMEALRALVGSGAAGWQTLNVGGQSRIAHLAGFTPFRWTFFVTESAGSFYRSADAIVRQTAYMLAASILIALVLLLYFAQYLTRPLRQVADAMAEIISTNDLSRRVDVLYKDETGRLGHTFNLMSEELGKAYDQVKGYALHAAVAQSKEQKIRHIFQMYVPKNVIDEFFASPDKMLVGANRDLAVLFSDVRDFTGISEKMKPDEMVESLNQYFAPMVEIIMNMGGIVDKYMGDGILAFFGAPLSSDRDALTSVQAGLDMLDSLTSFNAWQTQRGRRPFRIGIGINFGSVTVGNIGSPRKMDYTVMGDNVNLASRLEGLTKKYHTPLIVSESVYPQIRGRLKCRRLDRVAVLGRSAGTVIYEVRRSITATQEEAWGLHERALDVYYQGRFAEAERAFRDVLSRDPEDHCARLFHERCQTFLRTPPPPDWDGIEEMRTK